MRITGKPVKACCLKGCALIVQMFPGVLHTWYVITPRTDVLYVLIYVVSAALPYKTNTAQIQLNVTHTVCGTIRIVKAAQPSTLVTATYMVLGPLVNIITVLPVLGVHNTYYDIVEILANAQDMRKNGVQSVKPNILHVNRVIPAQTTVLTLVALVVRPFRQDNLCALMLIKSVLYVKLAPIIAPVLALMQIISVVRAVQAHIMC